MSKEDHIEPDELRALMRYDAETGKLFWRRRSEEHFGAAWKADRWNRRYAGKEAFTTSLNGYRRGTLGGRQYLAHRVIWAIVHGGWPENHIDHINGDPSDNRISNLRDVSLQENARNAKRNIRNKSGVVGVGWDKSKRKWFANIGVDGKLVNLGYFASISEAAAVRADAEKSYGFHENHGRGVDVRF